MEIRLKTTGDGSDTLFIPELNEHYHSTFGAIRESKHIFIDAGLKNCTKKMLTIFEVGFGTGLNCLLTFLEISNSYQKVRYDAIEPFPINELLLSTLNYTSILGEKLINSYNSIISAISAG